MSISNNSANEYIRLAAVAELQYNKVLVQALVSQQSRLSAVFEKHSRNNRDLQIIYQCNRDIEKILERKKKLMDDMKQEFGVYFVSKSSTKVKQIKNSNESISESENVSENEIEFHSSGEKSPVVHEKQKNHSLFACTYSDCSKEYKYQSALYNHVRRIHLKVKNYECEHCNAGFYDKGDWKRHLRVHTGEKPYQCTICHQKFTQNSSLKRHLRKHGEKPYQCSICHQKFNLNGNLKSHSRIHILI